MYLNVNDQGLCHRHRNTTEVISYMYSKLYHALRLPELFLRRLNYFCGGGIIFAQAELFLRRLNYFCGSGIIFAKVELFLRWR